MGRTVSRRSYGGLMSQPAFGLYDGGRLVATCRAKDINDAKVVFVEHNRRHPEWLLKGDRVRRIAP